VFQLFGLILPDHTFIQLMHAQYQLTCHFGSKMSFGVTNGSDAHTHILVTPEACPCAFSSQPSEMAAKKQKN